jgi:hypothetical protein
MTTALEQRISIEHKVVRKLIRIAHRAGWRISGVMDGEELVNVHSEKEIMDVVFSVDESSIRFRKGIGDHTSRGSVYIVLGNDGWDCIADCSMGDEFTKDIIEPIDVWIDTNWN